MKNYFKFPILIATALASFSAISVASKTSDTVKTDALSYKSLVSLDKENRAVVEFENEGHNLPNGDNASVALNGAKTYKTDANKISRLYAARMYTGNYSCSPINEVEQEVYLNGEVKTKTVNTTGGYVLGFDNGATATVTYTSSSLEDRYADLYVRVSNNNYGYSQGSTPFNTLKLPLKTMMSINLNDVDLAINDKATVFGRYYKDHTIVEDDINNTIKFAYEKNSSDEWDYKTTELNMYGRYLYQDWQTVLVGKVLIKSGTNNVVFKAKYNNRSGQLDCMILDFDKYDNKDVYEFEDAKLTGDAKTLANDSNEVIQDFTTYNEDYACSNHDFVKYAYNGSTLTVNNVKKNNFTNPHLILRISSVDYNNWAVSSLKLSTYLSVEINDSTHHYNENLYLEGRNDSTNHDPDGVSHGIVGSLNHGTTGPYNDDDKTDYSYRYLYLVWRTVDLGPITLNDDDEDGNGTNSIKFSIISEASGKEWIGFDFLTIADVADERYEAETFANEYVSRFANVCRYDGSSNVNSLKTIWVSMRAAYSNLSEGSKTIILSSEAVAGSTDPIERLLERYDYIGGKYNSRLVDDGVWDFLSRNPASPSAYSLSFVSKNDTNYLLILLLVLGCSISLTGFVVIYKNKKYKKQK